MHSNIKFEDKVIFKCAIESVCDSEFTNMLYISTGGGGAESGRCVCLV